MAYEPRELPIDVAHAEGFSRYSITRRHGGNASTLRHYWTKNPEGLAKWAESPTPFRTLVSHLVKYVKDPEGLAAEYYHDVFGHWPGPKFGKGGKGKRK
jgi:hypothetical protein